MQTIRDYMNKMGYDAIVIPSSDAHQNEYPAAAYQLRARLSGFTGSAGTLVVTKENAGLWTDGRYELQAAEELHGTGIDLYCTAYPDTPTITQTLRQLPKEAVVAVDGDRMSVTEFRGLEQGIRAELTPQLRSEDLWPDAPALPAAPLTQPEAAAAGGTIETKIARVREQLDVQQADAVFIGASEDIAWLFNLRGTDVPGTPIFYAYAWVGKEEAILFVPENKISDPIRRYLAEAGVAIRDYLETAGFLRTGKSRVLLDPDRTNVSHYHAVEDGLRIEGMNPTTRLKAVKSAEEITCLKEAYRRDGIALTNFFHWLETDGAGHTEQAVSEKLLEFRKAQPGFYEPSFDTIAGYGPNAAIIHYSPGEDSAVLAREGLLLLDSGGQYDCGTTDITRTLAMGPLSAEEQADYTLTLRSHIALAGAVFLKGTQGTVLDGFARYPMWRQKVDYRHGTGHGVGFMLSVHEGPISISRRMLDIPIEEGHVVSIEPGIYRAGKHGVRIENIGVVTAAGSSEFGEFLNFEMLSHCFIDTRPLDLAQLSADEKRWLNQYNKACYELLAPSLSEEVRTYLQDRTRPVY